MTLDQQIKMALIYTGITQAELARRMDLSPSNLSQRLKTGRFTKAELEKIAEILGASYRAEFVFPDGTVI